MAKKTTTKKTTTKNTATKATPKKAPAKKTPRMSASAARAEGAARTKRALQAKSAPKQPRSKNNASDRKPSGLDLAAKVLAEAKEPLQAKAIAERAIAAGWKTSGKTPHATLYAAMIREIAKKGKDARFIKTDRGLFKATGTGG